MRFNIPILQLLLCGFGVLCCFSRSPALPYVNPYHDKIIKIPLNLTGNDNSVADMMLQMVKSILKGQDPYVIHHVGPCEVCHVYGLQSMMRAGNVTSFETDHEKRINGNFGLKKISGTCDCAIGRLLYGYGKIHFLLNDLTFYLDLYARYEEDDADFNTWLMELNVTEKGTLLANFAGDGMMGWFVEKFTNVFHGYFVSRIREVIHGKIFSTTNQYKDSLNSL